MEGGVWLGDWFESGIEFGENLPFRVAGEVLYDTAVCVYENRVSTHCYGHVISIQSFGPHETLEMGIVDRVILGEFR